MFFFVVVLKLDEFKNCNSSFLILLTNDAFDILNSRSINEFEYKKAVCSKNCQNIKEFYKKLSKYLKLENVVWIQREKLNF